MSNPVEEYLKEYKNVCYTPRTLGKKLNISRKQTIYYCLSSKILKRELPFKVGSLKREMLLFKYTDDTVDDTVDDKVDNTVDDGEIDDEYEVI